MRSLRRMRHLLRTPAKPTICCTHRLEPLYSANSMSLWAQTNERTCARLKVLVQSYIWFPLWSWVQRPLYATVAQLEHFPCRFRSRGPKFVFLLNQVRRPGILLFLLPHSGFESWFCVTSCLVSGFWLRALPFFKSRSLPWHTLRKTELLCLQGFHFFENRFNYPSIASEVWTLIW